MIDPSKAINSPPFFIFEVVHCFLNSFCFVWLCLLRGFVSRENISDFRFSLHLIENFFQLRFFIVQNVSKVESENSILFFLVYLLQSQTFEKRFKLPKITVHD
ncbi:hypothetical protein D920_01749 [Enterococcus faecalis 13-SD-W-01]|nr:hypothetical protein D920_01749 [Enterococcus faecalis 13-SD-W-01]